MKKGQLAMESVMIYGVVILIVIVAIGALIRFGVFDLSNLFPESCDLGGSLQCEEFSVTEAGTVQLEIRNNLGKNIEVKKLGVAGEVGSDSEGLWGGRTDGTPNCNVATFDDTVGVDKNAETLVNGAKVLYEMTGCTIGIQAGKKIDGLVEIEYETVGSDIKRPVIGTIRATVS